MHTARVAALQVRREHGITGCPTYDDLCRVCDALGVQVDEAAVELRGRVKEAVAEGAIGLAPGLPADWKRWFLAHGLAHTVLHEGDHLCMTRRDARQWRHERDAEVFAGVLFWAHMLPPANQAPDLTPHQLADVGQLPLSCAATFLANYIDTLPPEMLRPVRLRAG